MSLYAITEEMVRIENLYLESVNEETGEIENIEMLEQLDTELKEMLVKKSEGIVKYFRNEEANIGSIKEEIARLTALKKRKEKKLEGFKNYIESNMIKIETKKIETSLGNISLRKSVKTVVNEDIVEKDERYWKQEITDKFDKTEIKKLLVNGEIIAGASLEESFSVSIK
jgi:hypothetical protein